jgi:hypothetical protein
MAVTLQKCEIVCGQFILAILGKVGVGRVKKQNEN